MQKQATAKPYITLNIINSRTFISSNKTNQISTLLLQVSYHGVVVIEKPTVNWCDATKPP